MYPDTFYKLHHILVGQHGLQSSQKFDSIEALGMFLWACRHRQCMRQMKERFHRGLGTVSQKFWQCYDQWFHLQIQLLMVSFRP
jgi:hypothetical protein